MSDPFFKGATIFYFSGTGNAKNVARWIKGEFESNDVDVNLQDISELEKRERVDIPDGNALGFISPTHGFNFPPIMFHFLLRLSRTKHKNKVFIVNTRAGMKIGKRFLPGLSGMAQYFTALILWLKGYRIIGMHPIDLPSNWISIHPGLKRTVVQSIYDRRRTETKRFAQTLLSNKKDLRAWRDIVQDLLITPIGFLYYLFGRFFLAKSFYASGKCNLCYKCERNCPINAIRIVDDRPYWTYRCESCMHCMNNCPERAIETGHGFLTLVVFFVNSVILVQLYQLSGLQQIIQSISSATVLKSFTFLLNNAILFACLFLSYRIMHYLIRYSFFEKIIRWTSLTTFRFWRRYKPAKFKKL